MDENGNPITAWLADTIYQTAGGTATAITLTINETLVNGFPITFIASSNNSGSATTINGKPLYKPNTTTAPTLVAGKAYTVWYNQAGNNFFIKASAEGTASVGDVLATKTFSNDNDAGLTGTLSLAGTALISDVVSGKTFYNTDAKTKLIGTNTNKKWAGGTYTPDADGDLTISGLTFKPSYIIATYNDYYGAIYSADVSTNLATWYANSGSHSYNLDGTYYYVNSTGFKIKTPLSNGGHWVAFE